MSRSLKTNALASGHRTCAAWVVANIECSSTTITALDDWPKRGVEGPRRWWVATINATPAASSTLTIASATVMGFPVFSSTSRPSIGRRCRVGPTVPHHELGVVRDRERRNAGWQGHRG